MAGKPVRQLVVIDGDIMHDWVEMFKGKTLPDGSTIRVVQASWIETGVTVYNEGGCMMRIAPVRESEGQIKRPDSLTVKPDFLLVRNQVRGPTPNSDKRNVLYGLMNANIPSINTLQSLYMDLERPVTYGALREIEKRVGHDKFPLISHNFYSGSNEMVISPQLPCVVKISHAHRGMGKAKIADSEAFRDISTVVALHDDYLSAEPFVDSDYGIRVQKIGNHYRVMKKMFTGSGWKSQFGGSSLFEIPLEEKYKLWADECAKCFGGMDLLAVDALHGKDGKDYILELNGSAIGLLPDKWMEDSIFVRDLTLERMGTTFKK